MSAVAFPSEPVALYEVAVTDKFFVELRNGDILEIGWGQFVGLSHAFAAGEYGEGRMVEVVDYVRS